METLGAMTMGGAVSDTIRKKIVNIEQFDANTTSDGEFSLFDIKNLKTRFKRNFIHEIRREHDLSSTKR